MLGLKRGTVYLSGHDPLWDAAAQQTIQVLKRVLGEAAADIQHVGSTSIRGIKAKPIIDLAVGVRDYEAVMAKREALGKEGIVFRFDERPEQLLFVMGDFAQDTRTHHIHVVLFESPESENYLLFRNYLNGNAAAAKEYEAVKEKLAAAYPRDREAYTAEKGPTVVKLLGEAYRLRR